MKARYWWPIAEQERLSEIFDKNEGVLASQGLLTLEPKLFKAANSAMISTVNSELEGIIDRDTLPSLCHLFVGFGNSIFNGHPLTKHIKKFAYPDVSGAEIVFQAHEEGDFHPWQTFCYLLMGGICPDEQLTSNSTFRQLATNCTTIYTQAMEDLGHLLFSLSHLGASNEAVFDFVDRQKNEPLTLDLYDIIANAIDAHHFGSFKVCRKFHLTEGLCAIASRMPDVPGLREAAQGFFSGQMDVLILLQRTIELAFEEEKLSAAGSQELHELRSALQIGRLFENHLYYVGHLVELACFGVMYGYDISPAQRNAATSCLNMCNSLIEKFALGMTQSEVLLPFSHYRRGMTLWPHVFDKGPIDLGRYSVDFAEFPKIERSFVASSPTFNFAVESEMMRPALEDVLRDYEKMRGDWPKALGHKGHFRRIIPAGWPRKLHYEFLDYGNGIGAELHFESSELAELLPSVREKVSAIVERVGAFEKYERYYTDRTAALRLVFPDGVRPADAISKTMTDLIEETFTELDEIVRR